MAFKNVLVLIYAVFAASASAEATDGGLTFRDKDGFSFEEFAGLSGDHGLSPEEVADMKKESKPRFDKLDQDKNGKLSQAELDKEEEEPEKSEELALGEEAVEDDEGADEDEAAADDDAGVEDMEEGAEELAEDGEAADEDDEDENTDMGLDEEQVSAMEAESEEVETALVEGTDTAQKMANQMLEDFDKNKDNQLSFGELAGGDDDKQSDPADADNVEDEEMKKEDEQVKQEMQTQFKASDKNGDNMLNMEELEAFHQLTGETA